MLGCQAVLWGSKKIISSGIFCVQRYAPGEDPVPPQCCNLKSKALEKGLECAHVFAGLHS